MQRLSDGERRFFIPTDLFIASLLYLICRLTRGGINLPRRASCVAPLFGMVIGGLLIFGLVEAVVNKPNGAVADVLIIDDDG